LLNDKKKVETSYNYNKKNLNKPCYAIDSPLKNILNSIIGYDKKELMLAK